MSEKHRTQEEHGRQLGRWVEAFAVGPFPDLEVDPEQSCSPKDVKRFLSSSFGSRFTRLMRELLPLSCAFDRFPVLVRTYVRTVPRAPSDINGPSDEERFLIWLARTQPLTPLQSDFVTLQRGEYAVGTEVRRNRMAHLQFQQLAKRAGERAARLGVDGRLRIHLNPIRFAGELLTSTFATEEQSPPIGMLFYAAGTRVRAIPLADAAGEALRTLAERGPCTLDEWAAGEAERARLTWLAGELAGVGVVAFD